jgi:hypothetical protein
VFKLDALMRQIGTDFMPMAAEKARAQDRAVVDHRRDRPQFAAPADPEPGLQRHQYTRSSRVLVGVQAARYDWSNCR